MNYDQFRIVWHEALGEAGLLPFPPWPSEAVDLRWMSRTYSTTPACVVCNEPGRSASMLA